LSDSTLIHPNVSIVIPLYNEQEGLEAFHQQLCRVIDTLPYAFAILYVNDGSTDNTVARLQAIAGRDERVTVIELSRNFGHQAALTAGLDMAEADYTITMDGDGQHPPEMIGQMLELAQAGYEVVLTQRLDQGAATAFKRHTSDFFYRLINRISDTHIEPGAADFRLLSRNAWMALRTMREYHRFLRGMVGWMGFRAVILPYTQPERLAGRSKYSLRKMLRLSMDAVFSFSLLPLYIIISLGVLFLLLAAAEVVYVLSLWLSHSQNLVRGWSSLMFMLLVVGGTLMVSLGLIGVYIGYIFQEVKRRPIYLVRQVWKKDGNTQSTP